MRSGFNPNSNRTSIDSAKDSSAASGKKLLGEGIKAQIKSINQRSKDDLESFPKFTRAKPTRSLSSSGENVLAKWPTRAQMSDDVKPKTGMVARHLLPMQKVAHDENCVIAVRSVDKMSTGLIDAGYPTKDMHIKGKSASWGPQAGLICVDQSFSKLESAPEKHAKFNAQTLSCVADGFAVEVPITLQAERLDFLADEGMITHIEGDYASFVAKAPSGKEYTFTTEKTINAEGDEVYTVLSEGKPVMALAPVGSDKPFTADYDLMMVAPRLENLSAEDKLKVPGISHEAFKQRVDAYKNPLSNELQKAYDSAEYFYQNMDKELGNVSKRVSDLIPKINEALVGDGPKVVHHGADDGSPVADPAANYPLTIFLPHSIGKFPAICMINNTKEFAEFIKQAKQAGFHVPMNPLWEKEITSIRRQSFTEAIEYFKNLK